MYMYVTIIKFKEILAFVFLCIKCENSIRFYVEMFRSFDVIYKFT